MGDTQSAAETRLGAPIEEPFDAAAFRESARETIRQLETALRTRIVIEQAKGILSERFDINVHEAFFLLRHASRSGRTSLRALAEAVVEHPEATPQQIAASLARPERWRNRRLGAPAA